MTQLAIKGHATRGKEVIEILEMLGGKNKQEVGAIRETCVYFIDGDTISLLKINQLIPEQFIVFTLEEFLKKFPYKVGDKVKIAETGKTVSIEDMSWKNERCEVVYETCYDNDCVAFYSAIELQPYKEETVKDNLVTEEDFNNTPEVEQEYMKLAENLLNQLIEGTHWKKCNEFDSQKMLAMFLKKNTSAVAKKDNSVIFDIPKGYEFAGVDDNNQQVVFTKIQPEYPKTYEECAKIMNCPIAGPSGWLFNFDANIKDPYYRKIDILMGKFTRLLICRDAYWKIAGEQIGLGKPWEPDWADTETDKYVIEIVKNTITIHDYPWNETNHLLAFPTREMRDIFYENFKDLIEQCKELL